VGEDIDPECIEWDTQNLSPAASFVLNAEAPPLPFPDAKFDLIYALSVFTHITAHWAAWLVELDRVLAPGGRLILTIMSEAMCQPVSGEPWDEGNVGMSVYREGQDWAHGGPMVLHSPWWIEEHWGRLFDIELLKPRGFAGDDLEEGRDDQGVVVLRKTERTATIEELERLDPAQVREAPALHHEVRHLRAEVAELRAQSSGAEWLSERLEEAEARARAAERTLAGVERSASWRLTAPLRRAKSWFR
jgi:SAM-dependent methyltransferase